MIILLLLLLGFTKAQFPAAIAPISGPNFYDNNNKIIGKKITTSKQNYDSNNINYYYCFIYNYNDNMSNTNSNKNNN